MAEDSDKRIHATHTRIYTLTLTNTRSFSFYKLIISCWVVGAVFFLFLSVFPLLCFYPFSFAVTAVAADADAPSQFVKSFFVIWFKSFAKHFNVEQGGFFVRCWTQLENFLLSTLILPVIVTRKHSHSFVRATAKVSQKLG